jgi:hypothetical protein
MNGFASGTASSNSLYRIAACFEQFVGLHRILNATLIVGTCEQAAATGSTIKNK